MARRLTKHECEAIDHLWQAHDLLKGNGTAKTAIQGVVDLLQDSGTPELTNTQYNTLPVNCRPMADPKRRGLIMRHGAIKGRYWVFRTECPTNGKQVEIEIGTYQRASSDAVETSIADARAKWEALHARRREGLPFTRDGKKLPIGEMIISAKGETRYDVKWLCDKYLAEYAHALNVNGDPVKRSAHDDEKLINRFLLPEFGDMPLADFDGAVIDELLDDLEGTPRQQQKLYSLLTVMNNVARKRPPKRAKIRIARQWIPSEIRNPMPDVTPVVAHTAERYASSNDEIQRYYGNLATQTPGMADVLALQVQTLSRINEVAELPWAEIDLDAGIWTLPAERAKNKHAHRVYLSTQSVALLRRRRAENPESPWVFPSPIYPEAHISKDTPTRAIAGNRDALGVDPAFTSHATRRRALTWMRENGITKEIRDAASNHHVSGVDQDYTETAQMERLVRNAVQSWCDFLDIVDSPKIIPLAGAG